MNDFQRKFMLKRQDYGILYPYIMMDTVTDINWNGRQLWIDDLHKGRYMAPEVLTDTTVSEESNHSVELEDALAVAMHQTMTEVMERGSYGISNRNELVAAFLQSMLQKVDKATSLTVTIHKLDEKEGTMDVEAVGEYMLPDRKKKQISVRRQIVFAGI